MGENKTASFPTPQVAPGRKNVRFLSTKNVTVQHLEKYGFTLTSTWQTMHLNAVGCTSHLTQMSKDMADDISSMAGTQEQHTEIKNNEILCHNFKKWFTQCILEEESWEMRL